MCLELGNNPPKDLKCFQKGLRLIMPVSWPSLVINNLWLKIYIQKEPSHSVNAHYDVTDFKLGLKLKLHISGTEHDFSMK